MRNDRLGDALLALPAAWSLHRHFPESRLILWASPSAAPLVACFEGIDRVIAGTDRESDPNLHNELAGLSVQSAYCLRPTLQNAITLWKARIPNRIGTSRRWFSFLFTHRINLTRRHSNHHETDLNLDFLASIGVKITTDFPQFNLPELARMQVNGILSAAGVFSDKPLILIHPGSGGSAREWPPQHFKILADRLADASGAVIAVTGQSKERAKCLTVTGDRHFNLCGELNLVQLAALISRAELLISNSTGPLHLAVALGRKVVGLYPPVRDCLPERWGPYGHPEWALMPNLPLCRKCKPGVISPCACMDALLPQKVFERAMHNLDAG